MKTRLKSLSFRYQKKVDVASGSSIVPSVAEIRRKGRQMNQVILKELVREIERNRDISGQAYAMKNNVRGAQYENIAVGLEQAYRIIANEMSVA